MSDAGNNCPNCGSLVKSLIPVDGGFRARLIDVGGMTEPPAFMCEHCQDSLRDSMSQGAMLRALEKQRDEQRRSMWNNRVNHVRAGRNFMQRKMLSEAAVEYEKYLRILEIVMDTEAGKLSYGDFKDPSAKKELTVIASVYWDLMVIYDSSNRYGARLQVASKKLNEFARFTPVFPDIVKRAASYRRKAKNPQIFKEFLSSAQANRPKCFIATSAFNSGYHPDVITLRLYRDMILSRSSWGRTFIKSYYQWSPRLACILDRFYFLKFLCRIPLSLVSRLISLRFLLAKPYNLGHRRRHVRHSKRFTEKI